MTISGISIRELTLLEAVANEFNRSILYKKGEIPTEITTVEREDQTFTAMALGGLTYPEFVDLDAWLDILQVIYEESNLAIALNCQKCVGLYTDYKEIIDEINVLLYIYKTRVDVIYADDLVNVRQTIAKDDAVYDENTKTITLGTLTLKLRERSE